MSLNSLTAIVEAVATFTSAATSTSAAHAGQRMKQTQRFTISGGAAYYFVGATNLECFGTSLNYWTPDNGL